MEKLFKKAITNWSRTINSKKEFELRNMFIAEWGGNKAIFQFEYVPKTDLSSTYQSCYVEVMLND